MNKTMNKSLKISAILFLCFIFLACENAPKKQIEKVEAGDNQTTQIENKTEEKPQTTEERINDIRKWYAEVSKKGTSSCKTKTKTSYDSFSPDSEPMPFEQNASACKFANQFELVEANLNGYEWGETIHIYKKDGKIFFVFVEGGAESWTYERRYYCDKDENVISHLEREGENGDQPSGPQTIMKLNTSTPSIRAYLSSEFKEIESILKTKI